ncbi:MAG TPA: hypothetical protein VGC48_05985 [Gemmatimonadales bacterium]
MLRHFSIVTVVTGLAAAISLACSDTAAPPSNTVHDKQPAISQTSNGSTHGPKLTAQTSGTANRLQAVSPVNSRVVWASGINGTFVVTTDGGATWRAGVVPGAETLQFRDVQGVSARVAYLLAAGSGTDSRIYKTHDGGATWTLQFTNQNPNAFYDCFDFWSPDRGITFSDAVGNRFPVIRTTNGRTWQDIGDRLPAALPGEAGFAASGTCVATQGAQRAWIGTGGTATPRVLATTDGGNSWQAYNTPLVGGPAAGVFTVAFRDRLHGIIAGGDLAADPTKPAPEKRAAVSSNGGQTWTLVKPPPLHSSDPADFGGTVFGLSYVPGAGRQTVVVTGPGGAAWSRNEGQKTWTLIPDVKGFWAVAFASRDAGWLVGTGGRILKVSFENDGHADDDDGDSNQDSNIGN